MKSIKKIIWRKLRNSKRKTKIFDEMVIIGKSIISHEIIDSTVELGTA